MTSRIVAIPLFAAIWLGLPLAAAAQDRPQETSDAPARVAVPRPPKEPRRAIRPEPAASPAPVAVTAAAEDQRRGGGRRGDRGGGDRGRDAGRRADRPGPRVAVPRPHRVPTWNASYRRPYYSYPPAYYDRWARHAYRWSPVGYVPWSLIYGSVGLSSYGYGIYGAPYPYGYPHGAGPWGSWGRNTTYDTGAIRLKIRPRDAQVFVNGYYAGVVDDFDGTFQQLRLEQGGHKIEVRMPGFENLQLDVHVQPNRTITIREELVPRP
jgi:hypothetical protein